MRKAILLGVLSVAVTMVSSASAAPAGTETTGIAEKGTLTIGAERMFGFSWTQLSTEQSQTQGGVTVTENTKSKDTTFGLLWHNTTSVYLVPRVGVDFTIIDNLTIGGTIGYVHSSNAYEDTTTTGGTTQSVSGDGNTVSGFLFAPRVGYVLPLGGALGLWLRGGISYYNLSTDNPGNNGNTKTSTTHSGFGLNVDPQLVISPAEHFGITVGLAVDLPLSGTIKSERTNGGTTTSVSYDEHFSNVALTAGIVGWL